MRSRTGIVLLATVVAAGAALGGWAWWRGEGSSRSQDSIAGVLADPARIREGEAIYRQHCAACHGTELQGQPNWRQRNAAGRLPAPPHDDSGHTWHHPDTLLFEITRNGMKPPVAPPGYESDMPGFGASLDDGQIWSVLGFIASRWPQREREHQARVTRAHRDAR